MEVPLPLTSSSEPQGPGTSKLDWRYFENNKVDRNELQVRKNLHKGTGTKTTYFFLSNCSIFQPFLILCLHFKENKQPVHMRYHFFLHYGWFLQNLGKKAVRTNMHKTVSWVLYISFSQISFGKKNGLDNFWKALSHFSETNWGKKPNNHKRLRQTLNRNSKTEITLFFVFGVHRTRKKR